MEITYNYRPPYSILLWSLLYIAVFILGSFFSSTFGFQGITTKALKVYLIVFSLFIAICLFWIYYRRNNKIIILNDNNFIVPHRWTLKKFIINYDEIISLTKFPNEFCIQIRDREWFMNIRKGWMKNEKEFESLYTHLLEEFQMRECHFMMYWDKQTPYNFKTDICINDIHIEYKNLIPGITGLNEGPYVGNIWINEQQYSNNYFSGPLLIEKDYIYLPYFDEPWSILAKIDLNTHQMYLFKDTYDIICLDHIENNQLYFYNDMFGENTLKSYDLKDQSLYQPFETKRK